MSDELLYRVRWNITRDDGKILSGQGYPVSRAIAEEWVKRLQGKDPSHYYWCAPVSEYDRPTLELYEVQP